MRAVGKANISTYRKKDLNEPFFIADINSAMKNITAKQKTGYNSRLSKKCEKNEHKELYMPKIVNDSNKVCSYCDTS